MQKQWAAIAAGTAFLLLLNATTGNTMSDKPRHSESTRKTKKEALRSEKIGGVAENTFKGEKTAIGFEKENIKLRIQLETALKQIDIEKERAKKLKESLERLKKDTSYLTETYIVKKDDCLWKIAENPKVYGDPYKWLMLYHANKDMLYDPDLIYPNAVLLVPRLPGTEKGEE